ncbi:MAG: hypothetical protein JWN83_2017 [Chitinophagaceae bacterium]|nr:hypothetical protein [Chitinophagaceae bacterium]
MKKILLTGTFFIMLSALFAQDAKKVKEYLDKKQYDKAKAEVDAAISKNPADPMALYYKSKVYAAFAADPQFKTSIPDAREQAFDAFKKAVDNDKSGKVYLVLIQDQYKPIFDLYGGYYDAGAAAFNNAAASGNKADFDIALTEFKNSDMVGRYIYSKKWALSELDTQLVLTIGKSAINAGKKEEAAIWLRKLADANISGTANDKLSYQLPYQWLSYYYKDAKDDANFLKYTSLGKKFFPKDDYYDAVMLDYYRDKKDYDALFKQYDEIIANYPDSVQYHFNYANEGFIYVYNSDAGTKINNKEALLKTIGIELQKVLTIKPNDINTNWLLGQYYYNAGIDVKDMANAIRSTKPEDIKKKADLNAQAKDILNKAIPYAEKALSTIEASNKKSDKSKYKSIVDLMQRIYTSLNQADKVKIYQAKYDSADAKFIN